jgi:hypothetical protein
MNISFASFRDACFSFYESGYRLESLRLCLGDAFVYGVCHAIKHGKKPVFGAVVDTLART